MRIGLAFIFSVILLSGMRQWETFSALSWIYAVGSAFAVQEFVDGLERRP